MRFLVVLLATLSFSAVAQVYKWTDENGVTHFGTQPPPGQQESVDIRDSSPGSMGATGGKSSDIIQRANRLERERRSEELKRQMQRQEVARSNPEDSWACQYSRDQVDEYEIRLRELGRRGYRQSEKDQLETWLRRAEREAERDCR